MPHMTGLELSHQIKRHWPDIPVIVATGFAEMAGEIDVALPKLAKPFTEEELATELDRVISARASGRVLKFRSRPKN